MCDGSLVQPSLVWQRLCFRNRRGDNFIDNLMDSTVSFISNRIFTLDIKCSTDCDCPLCAPFCSKWGYCQISKKLAAGGKRVKAEECSAQASTYTALGPWYEPQWSLESCDQTGESSDVGRGKGGRLMINQPKSKTHAQS